MQYLQTESENKRLQTEKKVLVEKLKKCREQKKRDKIKFEKVFEEIRKKLLKQEDYIKKVSG